MQPRRQIISRRRFQWRCQPLEARADISAVAEQASLAGPLQAVVKLERMG
jgi:hypothetical protein